MIQFKIKSQRVRIANVLLVTAISAGFILSTADLLSRKKIAANAVKAVNDGIRVLVPQAEKIEKTETGFKLFSENKNLIGWAFICRGQGYQGEIKILCALDAKFEKILGIEILESSETPGLGARINEVLFKSQFKDLSTFGKISYSKSKPSSNSQIQAITGATVSSKAVVDIINKGINEFKGKSNAK